MSSTTALIAANNTQRPVVIENFVIKNVSTIICYTAAAVVTKNFVIQNSMSTIIRYNVINILFGSSTQNGIYDMLFVYDRGFQCS